MDLLGDPGRRGHSPKTPRAPLSLAFHGTTTLDPTLPVAMPRYTPRDPGRSWIRIDYHADRWWGDRSLYRVVRFRFLPRAGHSPCICLGVTASNKGGLCNIVVRHLVFRECRATNAACAPLSALPCFHLPSPDVVTSSGKARKTPEPRGDKHGAHTNLYHRIYVK